MTRQKTPITYVSEARTRRDIKECFAKWGVEEYATGGEAGKSVRPLAWVRFSVNGKEQTIRCDRAWEFAANLRAIYRLLEALRMAAHYGIMEELAAAAAALLTEGRRRRPPHEVLGVQQEAPLEVAEAVYRQLARSRHPDAGGTTEAMAELNEAIEEFRRAKDQE